MCSRAAAAAAALQHHEANRGGRVGCRQVPGRQQLVIAKDIQVGTLQWAARGGRRSVERWHRSCPRQTGARPGSSWLGLKAWPSSRKRCRRRGRRQPGAVPRAKRWTGAGPRRRARCHDWPSCADAQPIRMAHLAVTVGVADGGQGGLVVGPMEAAQLHRLVREGAAHAVIVGPHLLGRGLGTGGGWGFCRSCRRHVVAPQEAGKERVQAVQAWLREQAGW